MWQTESYSEVTARSVSCATIGADVMDKDLGGLVYRVSLLRTYRPVTVASFRTWRGWRE
jgi:hypothetical protein